MEEDAVYDEFAPDQVAGITIMCLAAVAFLIGFGSFNAIRVQIGLQSNRGALLDLVPFAFLAIMLAVAAGLAFGGNCIRDGERRGFIIVLVLSLPLLFGGPMNIVVALLIGGYCGLRLWGRLGPEPTT
ncbi:MAG TPA: hypothetical protein VGE01_01430 [Fimbriimonas sp.]